VHLRRPPTSSARSARLHSAPLPLRRALLDLVLLLPRSALRLPASALHLRRPDLARRLTQGSAHPQALVHLPVPHLGLARRPLRPRLVHRPVARLRLARRPVAPLGLARRPQLPRGLARRPRLPRGLARPRLLPPVLALRSRLPPGLALRPLRPRLVRPRRLRRALVGLARHRASTRRWTRLPNKDKGLARLPRPQVLAPRPSPRRRWVLVLRPRRLILGLRSTLRRRRRLVLDLLRRRLRSELRLVLVRPRRRLVLVRPRRRSPSKPPVIRPRPRPKSVVLDLRPRPLHRTNQRPMPRRRSPKEVLPILRREVVALKGRPCREVCRRRQVDKRALKTRKMDVALSPVSS